MALLKPEISFSIEPIQKLVVAFPEIRGRMLSLFGKRARTLLKQDYLSGQDLNLNKYPVDKKGRYTITSDVNRARTAVKIYSYPVNLFERGRKLRNGSREPGKYTITKKLKQAVLSRSGTYLNEFENKILNTEIKKAGF